MWFLCWDDPPKGTDKRVVFWFRVAVLVTRLFLTAVALSIRLWLGPWGALLAAPLLIFTWGQVFTGERHPGS